MEFLAILVALAVLQLGGSAAPLQQDRWFWSYRKWVGSRLDGAQRQAATVLVPGLLVLLLQSLVEGALFGLAELALFLLVFLYAVGRGNPGAALTDYLQRWSRGDFQAAFEQLSDPGCGPVPVADALEHPAALHVQARRWLYYRGFERLFPVLFWFVLLGPAGAMVYRVAVLEREAAMAAGQADAGADTVHWLDWIPVRLAGISFALVGNFDACLYAWQRILGDARVAATDVLEGCGNAALALGDPDSGAQAETTDALIARGSRELQGVENLYRRSLLVWLAIIAALAMIF